MEKSGNGRGVTPKGRFWKEKKHKKDNKKLKKYE